MKLSFVFTKTARIVVLSILMTQYMFLKLMYMKVQISK